MRVLIWHNTEDGHKGRNPPRPIQRPGVERPTVKGLPVGDLRREIERLRKG